MFGICWPERASTCCRWFNVFALAGGTLYHIIDVIGRAAIEAVLEISDGEGAGEKQPGRKREGGAAYRGRRGGRRPCGPGREGGQVAVVKPGGGGGRDAPYESLRQPSGLGNRVLLAGLGTRSSERAIGQMAKTVCRQQVLGERSGEQGGG